MDDEPLLAIADVHFPNLIQYIDRFNKTFTLTRKSYSSPKNITLIIIANGRERTQHLEASPEEHI